MVSDPRIAEHGKDLRPDQLEHMRKGGLVVFLDERGIPTSLLTMTSRGQIMERTLYWDQHGTPLRVAYNPNTATGLVAVIEGEERLLTRDTEAILRAAEEAEGGEPA